MRNAHEDNRRNKGIVTRILWRDRPEDEEYASVEKYLSLMVDAPTIARIVSRLRSSDTLYLKVKDILRASRLPILGVSQAQVLKNMERIKAGKELPPILLLRDYPGSLVVLADSYYLLCAVFAKGEDVDVPCRIA